MSTFWVAVLLITEFVLFAVAYINFKRDFVSPSVVTLFFFILSTACCLYGLSDWKNVVFTYKAYLLFTTSFILMIITENFVFKRKIVKGSRKKICLKMNDPFNQVIYIPEPVDTLLFIVFISLSFYYIYKVYKTGMELGATGLFSTIGVNKEKGNYDALSRLAFNLVRMASYIYAVMVSHNIICCGNKIKKNIKGILIIIATLLITFFSGQRSTLICYAIGVVVAASIALHDSAKFKKKNINKKFMKKLFIIGIVAIGIFYLSSNIVKGTNVERKFVEYITYYFGSTTALMGCIVEDPSLCHTPFAGYFGEKTFNGFWNTMYSWGFVDVEPATRAWIKMGSHVETRAGNEYTFFCGPYIDFGFVGTLIFIVCFYAFFSHIYYHGIMKKNISLKRVSISAVYIFLYAMIAMAFYQDTIRSYSRPINILYIVYIIVFCKIFIKFRRNERTT